MEEKKPGLISAIISAGIVAGTLDITAAIIQTLINGGNPLKMLQFVASGIFGETAFAGGMPYSFWGLLFHYMIAFGWTILFFKIYPKFTFLSKNVLATGIGYGLFVWLVMNRVVLPLSNTPPRNFQLTQALIAMVVLILAIGLPLSVLARRYYSGDKKN